MLTNLGVMGGDICEQSGCDLEMMVIPNVADGGNWNKEMITVVVLRVIERFTGMQRIMDVWRWNCDYDLGMVEVVSYTTVTRLRGVICEIIM